MYPQPDLRLGTSRKAVLLRAIALRRVQLADAAARATQPLELLDRVVEFWKRLGPFTRLAAVSVGVFGTRRAMPRLKTWRSILRWVTIGLGALRVFRAVAANRARADDA